MGLQECSASMSSQKALVVMAATSAILCIVAIITASVALTTTLGSASYNVLAPPQTPPGPPRVEVNIGRGVSSPEGLRKVWTIALGADYGGHEYVGDGGYIEGMKVDLITEVCAAAGIVCRTMWDPYNHCWDSVPGQYSFGGKGLLGGWYDACGGWLITQQRLQVFQYSLPFLQNEKIYFWVKPGSRVNITDLTGLTIGFIDGWWSDEKCLGRLHSVRGAPLSPQQVKHYHGTSEVIQGVLRGEVDAAFLPELAAKDLTGKLLLQKVPMAGEYYCSMAGNAMMTRKDNDFNTHWNRGFQSLLSNGRFKKLCEESKVKHGARGHLTSCVG